MNAFSETVDRAKGLAILLVLLGHIALTFPRKNVFQGNVKSRTIGKEDE